MFHLMMKDIYTQKKTGYFAPIFLVPYFLMMGKDIPSAGIYASVIYSLSISFIAYFMMMYSNFSTNESEIMQNRLLVSLPIMRKSLIQAKYLMVSVWWFFTFLLCIGLFFVLRDVFHFESMQIMNIRVVIFSLCFTYILTSFFYPIHFRFGYRAATFFGIAMFFVVTSGLGKLLSLNKNMTIASVLIKKPSLSLAVITLIFVLVSYLISVSVFEKKDL